MAQRGKIRIWLDCILVLFNVVNGGLSVLPMLLLFDNIPLNLVLGIVLNSIWLILNVNYVKIKQIPKVLIPYFIVLSYQLFLGRFEFSAATLLVNLTFFYVLNGFYCKYTNNTINLLTNTYISYSLLNVIGVVLAFILITQGLLDPFSNSIDISILAKDDEVAFFPGHLTIIRPNDGARVSFLPVIGLFSGYSHEPHVVGYICLPAFFYLLYKLKKQDIKILSIIIIILYLLFFLITLSATSFITLTMVTGVGLFLSGFQRGGKKNWVFLAILVILVIIFAAFISDSFSFVFDKMTEEEGSRGYSVDRISYAFTPKTIFGTTIYSTEIDGDIGVITAVLNVVFYISMGLLCFRLLRKNDKASFYAGLACLYFLLHSMKAFLMIYRYSFTPFMVFLSCLIYHTYNDSLRKSKQL